jgi:hypothetical protein
MDGAGTRLGLLAQYMLKSSNNRERFDLQDDGIIHNPHQCMA